MKLIRGKGKAGKCKALTNSGKQCSRDAVEKGYCKQHFEIAKEQGKIVTTSGNRPLNEIPEPPITLEKRGMVSWNVYCQQMIDEGRLYQSYLYPLADLCDLEDQLAEVRTQLKTVGAVNVYENGIQRNGYASHYDRILQNIRNLRADYGLTDKHNTGKVVKKEPKKDDKSSKRSKSITGYGER